MVGKLVNVPRKHRFNYSIGGGEEDGQTVTHDDDPRTTVSMPIVGFQSAKACIMNGCVLTTKPRSVVCLPGLCNEV
jgi:hypothetical protein